MNWLYGFDMSVFRAINIGMHRSWLDPFFTVLSYVGLGQVTGLLCLGFAFNKSTRHYVIPLIVTDAVAGFLIADGLKSLISRDRPSNLAFALPQEGHLISSFPSGHTTTSFAVATMLVFLTWNTKYRRLGQSSLILAFLIGLSRIYRGVHWPTDVAAGACFGVATSCVLYMILPRLGIGLSDSPPSSL